MGNTTEHNELERDKLIVEARQLIADAGDGALSEEATARFSEIEKRLDEIRAEQDNRPAIVDPTRRPMPGAQGRPDPFAEFGLLDGVPSLTPSRQDMAQLFTAAQHRQPMRVDTPTTLRFATVGTAQAGTETDYVVRQGLPQSIRRLAEFAGLGSTMVAMGSKVEFPVFGGGNAAIAAEGATKAEYDAITSGDASPKVIAVWTDLTAQMHTMAGFEARLRNKLSALIAKQEDALLVSTALGTTGIQTYTAAAGEAAADSLLHAAVLVTNSAVGADPDVAVMNPADVVEVFSGSVGMSGERPENVLRLSLHGLRVYPSSAVAAGTALVGAWSAGSQLVVGLRPIFMVDPYSQMKSNKVTVLGEEAVNLMVDEPEGFVKVTFA
ncbi:phage major capsid protein [Amycolatopsis taiwanensis]|uniref:Phage capsid-like C-terminal domain-containing protein n=1 Tax=Amycolatopsis taiwanensis TaxID=342230 RepID=A0A9W6QTG3_9PSEU|nr:phage major capsid protein [Amycolatopsis taiwanensis]GLY63716.1 hypothetical protein Atai01_03350 [Amycolatopsis taiwanensis]